MRISAARALKDLLTHNEREVPAIVDRLIKLYNEYLVMTPAVYDNLGRILQESIDKWEGRCGVGISLRDIAPLFPIDVVITSLLPLRLSKCGFLRADWLLKSEL